MKSRIIVLVLLVLLGLSMVAMSSAAPVKPKDYNTNSCSRWAYNLEKAGGKPTSTSFATQMYIKGCERGATKYTWQPVHTRCMNLARYFTNRGVHGLPAMKTYMKPYRCVWQLPLWR